MWQPHFICLIATLLVSKKSPPLLLYVQSKSSIVLNNYIIFNLYYSQSEQEKRKQSAYAVIHQIIDCAEERRIAYVAATRAETNLYWCPTITKAEGRKPEGDIEGSYKTKRTGQSAFGEVITF